MTRHNSTFSCEDREAIREWFEFFIFIACGVVVMLAGIFGF